MEHIYINLRNKRNFWFLSSNSEDGIMVTYGGMAKKPITVSTSAMIFKVMCVF